MQALDSNLMAFLQTSKVEKASGSVCQLGKMHNFLPLIATVYYTNMERNGT